MLVPLAGWMPLEDRIVPAEVSLAGGVLAVAASAGESNELSVQLSLIRRVPWVIVTESGPGVPLGISGSGLFEFRPGAVGAPLAQVLAIEIATGHEEDEGTEADSVSIALNPRLPNRLTVSGGAGTDQMQLSGTYSDDALSMDRERNAEGFKIVRAEYSGKNFTINGFEQLTVDFSQDGNDSVTLDRYVSGLDRPMDLQLIGGGIGQDTLEVIGSGDVPQLVELDNGTLGIVDDVPGEQVFLGRSDNVAIQQPLVTVEVIDEGSGDPVSLGPETFNQLLLDTGATGLVFVDIAAAELEFNGIIDDGDYEEQGVAGFTLMDVSAPYRFDFAGRSGIRNTIQDARILYNSSLSFSFLGPWGIIGMPVMMDRVTELDMTGWSNPLDALDLSIGVEFSDDVPGDLQHARSVPLRMVDFPHDGQVDDGPLPTFAPLPFLSVEGRDDGRVASGEFLLDTGAQLSLISTNFAIEMGLDKNSNGTLVDEALDFIEVGGIGGTTMIPMVAFDQIAVPTEEGQDLIWTELFVGVLDIEVEDGPSFDGVFGMDFLTSGWASKILPPLLGLPGTDEDGYFSHVYFDFRQATSDGVGTMVLNITPERDQVIGAPPLPLSIAHAGFDTIAVSTGSGNDRFLVSPSTSTTFVLGAGGPGDFDTFQLLPDGQEASNDGSTILVPGFLPILHSGFESVDLGSASSLLAGGGFERPEAGPAGVGNSWLSPVPGASPWTFSPSSSSAHSGVSANGTALTSSNPPAPEGDQVAYLQREGRIAQEVQVNRAGSYQLSFQAAQRGNSPGGPGHDFAVAVDGVEVARFSPSGSSYEELSVSLVLDEGMRTITFVGLNSLGGDRSSLIDDVLLELVDSITGGGSGMGGPALISRPGPALPVPFGMNWRELFGQRSPVVRLSTPFSIPGSDGMPTAIEPEPTPVLDARARSSRLPLILDRPSPEVGGLRPARSAPELPSSPSIIPGRRAPNQGEGPQARTQLADLDVREDSVPSGRLADWLRLIRR
jgi:hypothetical protein